MKSDADSPTDDDIERINGQLDFSQIDSLQDYQTALEEFMNRTVSVTQAKNMFRNADSQNRFGLQQEFKKAQGRDLERDRQQTARITVSDVAKYTDARKTDLVGLDTARKFGYTQIQGQRVRRMIDSSRTKIVTLPPSYKRTVRGKVQTVHLKETQQLRVYNKEGRRLSLKRSN